MAQLRFNALQIIQNREKVEISAPSLRVSDYFGELTYTLRQMKASLSPEIFKRVQEAIDAHKTIDSATADAVAAAVRVWAMTKGATHFTHWFQPLHGSTAEKHDAFFDAKEGLEILSGKELVQQEPDASSFPSGGIRSTFEARGYTAWDPSSPMFIYGTTLCIPTVFIAFTGEALDYKAPLLKSLDVLDKAATKVCRIFDRNVSKVTAMLGVEQEFYVLDKALYEARPDLVMGGRTVFGHNPARGQQLGEHYFGSIPPRIYDFLREVEIQAHRLGIPLRTRHNEVAPSQYEVAPSFSAANVSADQNQLLKDLLNRVAERHKLKVLFHEKPFAGLNGSGKHCNWSLFTDGGVNIFQPTTSARENLLFLIFLVVTIKAVSEHADLLRASVASAGNDHRLGNGEAPPAIMSVYLGKALSKVLDDLESSEDVQLEKGDNIYYKLGIDQIPEIIIDNTDRNRTSPFAFTGNKFEFRAVGADANVAHPLTIMNLIVADTLSDFFKKADKRIEAGEDRRFVCIEIMREYLRSSKKIRFEGDGYSPEWHKESKKRGLENLTNTPASLQSFLSEKTRKLFDRNKILNHTEMEARFELLLDNYILKIQIDSRMMNDLALNHIIPTAITYQNKLIQNAKGLKDLGIDETEILRTIAEISKYVSQIRKLVSDMTEERKRINTIENTAKRAEEYNKSVREKYFDEIRYAVDKLELLVDDEDWPLIKYRELLFLR